MPYQFENRYTLTDEMVLEYVSQVCCKTSCGEVSLLSAWEPDSAFCFSSFINAFLLRLPAFLPLPAWCPGFTFHFSFCAATLLLSKAVPDTKPWCVLENRSS